MSFQWINTVIACGPSDTSQRFVLMVLANYANDEGECYPSMPMIERATALCERQVRRHVRALETGGYLSVTRQGRGRGVRSVYQLLEKGTSTSPISPPKEDTGVPLSELKEDVHVPLSKNGKGDISSRKGDIQGIPFNAFNEKGTTNLKNTPQPPKAPVTDAKGDTPPKQVIPIAAALLGNRDVYAMANRIAVATPEARLRSWHESEITYAHRIAIITAAKHEAHRLGVSVAEAMTHLLYAVETQVEALPPDRWQFQGNIETYFGKYTYRANPQHLTGGNNGKSKGERTVAAVQSIAAELAAEFEGGCFEPAVVGFGQTQRAPHGKRLTAGTEGASR